ncbi:hypothetical protein [Desulfatitalea alkaliphila]|uniref:Thioredoxin domain-containing protein n=1 Tax=Desulfatitalea alkaliphila TaxID=2929485 RepID=A0AA41R1N6_9BACT|nr:hypothetical protein [Desulfatitalea alkaliphila]MCJ8499585.1 hypothetical protein [Desulfatitalea alkaliphila]
MAEAVKVLPDDIQQIITVDNWDMRTRQGVQRFRELKAKSLPSIALDGELVYESLIPMQEELIAAIRQRYVAKNKD